MLRGRKMLEKPDPELIQYFRKDSEWDILKKLFYYLGRLKNAPFKLWFGPKPRK